MPQVQILNGPSAGQVLDLPPGDYRVGRATDNGFQIDDDSVAAHHCEWQVGEHTLFVRDLGSAQGTCINGELVESGEVAPGQRVRVGNIELRFEPAAAGVSPVRIVAGPKGPTHTPVPAVRRATLRGNRSRLPPPPPQSFWRALPGVWFYPFRGLGPWVLVTGIIFFRFMEFLQGAIPLVGLILAVISGGYLFAYLQSVVASSAQGDAQAPSWPEVTSVWDEVVRPYLLVLALFAVCFGPGLLLLGVAAFEGGGTDPETVPYVLGLSLCVLGGLYFPMALLGVAVADGLSGLNPMIVIPSIVRVAGAYLTTCVVMAVAFVLQAAVDELLAAVSIPLFSGLASWFVRLYLLMSVMRLLGLVYYTGRRELGWFPE
jgi:hypothetical protein